MAKKTGFIDIVDELNWYALVMSEGNFEAAKEFVAERNRTRERSDMIEKEF